MNADTRLKRLEATTSEPLTAAALVAQARATGVVPDDLTGIAEVFVAEIGGDAAHWQGLLETTQPEPGARR